MRRPNVPALLIASALIAGCGASSSTTTTGNAPSTAAATVRTTATATGPLGEVRHRLVAAGFHPRAQDVSDALAGLDVGDVDVAAYATVAEAERDYRQIKRTFAASPGRGVVAVHGAHLYFLAHERQLTATERSRFAKVVITGEAIGP